VVSLNRAERRRAQKDEIKTTKTYNLRTEELEVIKKDAALKAIETALNMMIALPIMVLHDKFGFGPKRTERLIDEIKKLYDSFDEGYLTIEDIKNTIYEELGIEIDM
jgi:hypothetical protein